jgi:translation initiation factor 1
MLQKRAKGKIVSLASGFAHKPEDMKKLAKKLKKVCGSGGSNTSDTIEIQGEHCEKICEYLINAGYKAKVSGR